MSLSIDALNACHLFHKRNTDVIFHFFLLLYIYCIISSDQDTDLVRIVCLGPRCTLPTHLEIRGTH